MIQYPVHPESYQPHCAAHILRTSHPREPTRDPCLSLQSVCVWVCLSAETFLSVWVCSGWVAFIRWYGTPRAAALAVAAGAAAKRSSTTFEPQSRRVRVLVRAERQADTATSTQLMLALWL